MHFLIFLTNFLFSMISLTIFAVVHDFSVEVGKMLGVSWKGHSVARHGVPVACQAKIQFTSYNYVDKYNGTQIKKKIKFSSYIRKFRVEQLQSHIWLTASSYMGKYFRILFISSYIRKPLLIYDFATAPLWISLYMRKIWFSFLSVYEDTESFI